ncbi:hypothetical protein C8R44DRAFT_919315 [Mycena epipterygia]|nr:hypothetical protein C8R44DRAFT_919315 [Mycena epipterygia]
MHFYLSSPSPGRPLPPQPLPRPRSTLPFAYIPHIFIPSLPSAHIPSSASAPLPNRVRPLPVLFVSICPAFLLSLDHLLHLPLNREHALAAGITRVSPKQDDILEVNANLNVHLPELRPGWDTDDEPLSMRWDSDWWRLRKCFSAWREPDRRLGAVYEPGIFTGLWQGRMLTPSEDHFNALVTTCDYPPHFDEAYLGTTTVPVFMRIEEHHSLAPHVPMPCGGAGDDWDDRLANGYFPPGARILSRARGISVASSWRSLRCVITAIPAQGDCCRNAWSEDPVDSWLGPLSSGRVFAGPDSTRFLVRDTPVNAADVEEHCSVLSFAFRLRETDPHLFLMLLECGLARVLTTRYRTPEGRSTGETRAQSFDLLFWATTASGNERWMVEMLKAGLNAFVTLTKVDSVPESARIILRQSFPASMAHYSVVSQADVSIGGITNDADIKSVLDPSQIFDEWRLFHNLTRNMLIRRKNTRGMSETSNWMEERKQNVTDERSGLSLRYYKLLWLKMLRELGADLETICARAHGMGSVRNGHAAWNRIQGGSASTRADARCLASEGVVKFFLLELDDFKVENAHTHF